MKLLKIKEKIKSLYHVGTSRIRFTESALKKIKELNQKASLGALARELYNGKLCRIVPLKTRKYKIYYVSKRNKPAYDAKRTRFNPESKTHIRNTKRPAYSKVKYKDVQSLSYCKKRKIVDDKIIWMRKVRTLRSYLKRNKDVVGPQYRRYRSKIKGNNYKRIENLQKEIKR